jgi:vacuolar protein sorting-associated protein 35
MVEALAMVPAAELSLRLYLQCAEVFLAIYHISSSLALCNSPLKFLGNLQEIILVSTILQAAGDCGLEPVAYEFFTQAFVLYEEEVSDSKAQVTALQLIIGTLQRTRVFGVENRDTLTHKATGVS